jgi:K+/H+ antiporter YhaU regulatory subunit KhtT
VEHPPELELGDALLELACIGLDREQRVVVRFLARERVELAAVVESLRQRAQRMDDAVELLLLLAELLGARRVVPDLRILEFAVDRGEARRLDVVVKDTSEAGPPARAGLRSRCRSR